MQASRLQSAHSSLTDMSMTEQIGFTDEYVAELLKKDARERSLKLSSLGLQTHLQSRATISAPKPNIRFLKNILRETDTHNAALLARERRDARAKLRATDAHDNEEPMPARERHRRRQHYTHERYEADKMRDRDNHSGRSRHEEHSRRSRSPKRQDTGAEGGEHRQRYEAKDRERCSTRESQQRRRHRRHHGSKSPAYSAQTEQDNNKIHPRRRSRRYSNSSSSSYSSERLSKRRSGPASSSAEKPLHLRRKSRNYDSRHTSPPSDSDPLEALVGPRPLTPPAKVKTRGRGVFTSSQAMDSHFATDYDPSADVHPDSDIDDDWDQAMEALRDRQRWKQQGAERLRLAGFSEAEVKKWEKGGTEKSEGDVSWVKKGEGREWDRGKIMDTDGFVELKPEWGRLKGT